MIHFLYDLFLNRPQSLCEPLATWLAVQTFSQVVSTFALHFESDGFNLHVVIWWNFLAKSRD